MPLPAISLAVVGADHPNQSGPGRRFEILLCEPGDPVELRLEPKNPADPRAVAVYSSRGVQIGYLTAERCGWIGSIIRSGQDFHAVFQDRADFGAIIRMSFDGQSPVIHSKKSSEPEPDWWPDPDYGDDVG